MRTTKKCVAILLCMLLALSQVVVALGESEKTIPSLTAATEAGREANISASIKWHDLPLIDEDTNKIISSLMDATEFYTRYAKTDELSGYYSVGMKMSGQDAFTVDTVYDETTAYISSPVYGTSPLALSVDELGEFFTKLGTYMDSISEDGSEDYSAAMASMSSMFSAQLDAAQSAKDVTEVQDPMDALTDVYEVYGLGEALDVADKWVDKTLVGETYEGPINSAYGLEIASATSYMITKEDLIELVSGVMKTLEGNTEFWSFALANYSTGMEMVDEDTPTLEEIMESVPELTAEVLSAMEQIPEETIIRYLECYDDQGNYIASQVETIVPGNEEGTGEFSLYMEWLADTINFYMEAFQDANGFTAEVAPKADVAEGVKDDGFSFLLSIYQDNELYNEVYIDTTSVASDSEDGRVWDAGLMIAVADATETMGVNFILNQVDTYKGEDITQDVNLDMHIFMNDTSMPVLTLTATAETGEPQGPAFDITDASILHPAQMTDAEFAEWMNNVSMSAMQNVFGIIALLPADVLSVMMQDQMPATTGAVQTEEAAPAAEAEPALETEEAAEEVTEEPATEEAPTEATGATK